MARIQYPRDPIEQDRYYSRPQQFDHYNNNTRYIPNARLAYPEYQDPEQEPAYKKIDHIKGNLQVGQTKNNSILQNPFNIMALVVGKLCKFSKYAESQSWPAKKVRLTFVGVWRVKPANFMHYSRREIPI